MMTRIAVLGAGLVGGLIARDLAADGRFRVTSLDASDAALDRLANVAGIERRRADLSDPSEVRRASNEADLVIVAVPGFLGHAVVRAVLEARRPLVDIAFAPEDALALDPVARSSGVPAIVDCGVAPGLSNLFVGASVAGLDGVERVLILVGGLPLKPVAPWDYRLVFSLTDVLEEYTRPSRFREGGKDVVRPALSEVELVDLPRVGTLEAFNTDGLRSLLATIDAPDLKEKTLRWPGHADRMRALRDSGFLDETPLSVDGASVRPRAVTERLLRSAWERAPDEEEFTVLRVVVEGRRAGRRTRTTWDLYDRTDPVSGATSMARTTGFPCALAARLIAEGRITTPGVHPPEVLGRDGGLVEAMLSGLASRGVAIERRDEVVA